MPDGAPRLMAPFVTASCVVFGFTPDGRGGIAEWNGALNAVPRCPLAILIRGEDMPTIARAICGDEAMKVTGYLDRMRRETIPVIPGHRVMGGTAFFQVPDA